MAGTSRNKELVIIKQKMSSLANLEPFLLNRNWEIYTSADLAKALNYVVARRPQFLMIPADHPDMRLSLLPKILAQAYNICIMHYLEFPSGRNIHTLNQIKSDYILPTPVTAPAIERMAFKYFQLTGEPQETTNSRLRGESVESEIIKKGPQLLTGEITPKSAVGDLTVSLYDPVNVQNETDYIIKLLNDEGQTSNLKFDSVTGVNLQSTTTVSDGSSSQNGPEKEGSFSIRPNLDGKSTPSESSRVRIEPQKPRTSLVLPPKTSSSAEDNDSYLFLRSASYDALDRSADKQHSDKIASIDEITNVACIIIESSRFSGYLIAAMGKDRKIDEQFMETVQVRLLDFLRKREKNVNERSALELKITRVAFEPWAEDCAKFLVRSVHQGEDVAMAFFPHGEINYTLAESASEEMAAISIDYLSEDSPADFNIYMYLPINEKYLLYTPKGGRFYNNQRDRLKGKGVTHMHIERVDIPEFGKYRIQSHLNAQIREHLEEKIQRKNSKKVS